MVSMHSHSHVQMCTHIHHTYRETADGQTERQTDGERERRITFPCPNVPTHTPCIQRQNRQQTETYRKTEGRGEDREREEMLPLPG